MVDLTIVLSAEYRRTDSMKDRVAYGTDESRHSLPHLFPVSSTPVWTNSFSLNCPHEEAPYF